MQQQQQNGQQQADQQWNDTLRQQQSRANADMAQAAAVRRSWEQRPALAPDRNPLLGRWESLGAGQQRAAAGVLRRSPRWRPGSSGGIPSGLSDSMLGWHDRVPSLEPSRSAATVMTPMYRTEYRGGDSRGIAAQGGTPSRNMITMGSDRATVATVGCGCGAPAAGARRWRWRPRRRRRSPTPRNGRCLDRRSRTAAWTSRARDDPRSAGRRWPICMTSACPSVRGQVVPVGAQPVRIRLRRLAQKDAVDDRLCRAHGAGRRRRIR
jgi:hypothetical protein